MRSVTERARSSERTPHHLAMPSISVETPSIGGYGTAIGIGAGAAVRPYVRGVRRGCYSGAGDERVIYHHSISLVCIQQGCQAAHYARTSTADLAHACASVSMLCVAQVGVLCHIAVKSDMRLTGSLTTLMMRVLLSVCRSLIHYVARECA